MSDLTALWRQCRLYDRPHDVVYCDPSRAQLVILRQPRPDPREER